jgi:hypothetical protein
MGQITPVDPVTLGLCSQIALDENVAKAAAREERRLKKLAKENGTPISEVLKEADETTAIDSEAAAQPAKPEAEPVATDVFSDVASSPDESSDTVDALRPEDVFKSN